jgi:hypothetical protein
MTANHQLPPPTGPRYAALAWTSQKTLIPTVPLLLRAYSSLKKHIYCAIAQQWMYKKYTVLHGCIGICCHENAFTVLLPSNDCLCSFHYTGFQPLCHNMATGPKTKNDWHGKGQQQITTPQQSRTVSRKSGVGSQ